MPKKIKTATMKGTRKIVRQREIWRDEVEKNLCTMGTKKTGR